MRAGACADRRSAARAAPKNNGLSAQKSAVAMLLLAR